MFYEYAVDPKLLNNWKDLRYFTEKFGWEKGRLIACFPKKWKRLVYDSLLSCGEIERKCITEKLNRIDDRMIKRSCISYDPDKTWLENTIIEHQKSTFRLILAKNIDNNHPDVVLGEYLDENSEPRWKPPNKVVPRQAEEYAAKLMLLLQFCDRIIFVDPYFDPMLARFRNSLKIFLKEVFNHDHRKNDPKVELHTSIERWLTPKTSRDGEENLAVNLISNMKTNLPNLIPKGKFISIIIWKKKKGGENIHNRYILTDKAGVSFGTGLDEMNYKTSADRVWCETDDIHRLDKDVYAERWRQYTGEKPAFDLVKLPVTVIGI